MVSPPKTGKRLVNCSLMGSCCFLDIVVEWDSEAQVLYCSSTQPAYLGFGQFMSLLLCYVVHPGMVPGQSIPGRRKRLSSLDCDQCSP